ncbi:hypothetical protein GCM10009846_29030 [Agrococcus versicolor]|uniref:Uncharacterized protein n=1 Tax=Agrococcus versicolor TaxID=501482 RepID=A0ABN3AXW6_9MICO
MTDDAARRQQPMSPQPAGAALGHGPGHAPGQAPGHAPGQAPGAPSGGRPPRRVLGIQPVLLVGIVLLTLVTLLTIVLIFIGDIETQAPRVVWTVIAFLGFTALLALDLALARRSALPLVIGVTANVYLLAILMLATWVDVRSVEHAGSYDPYAYEYEPPLGIRLIGVYLLALVVVRAAAAGAWALIALGRRGMLAVSRVVGVVAAVLLGLAGVLLTLHLAITPFGIEVGDLYWRCTVAIVVLAALAACVTILLYWSRRQLEPRPALVPAATLPDAGRGWPAPGPQQGWAPQPGAQQGWAQPGGQQGWPGQGGAQQGWPGQGGAQQGWPQPQQQAPQQVPNPMQPAPQDPQQPWGRPPA